MVNPNYNKVNYRMKSLNFYYESPKIKYLVQRFDSEGGNLYQKKDAWNELMNMQISTYEDYGSGKKKKKKFEE